LLEKQTDGQWMKLKSRLTAKRTNQRLWEEAYLKFYFERIETRYLRPMQLIERSGAKLGEGFAMVALFCTLVEYLESCEQGKNFRYPRGTGPYEYGIKEAGVVFKSFLRDREPFRSLVPSSLVDSFYQDVRCGLLHEAKTKGRWEILPGGSSGVLIKQSNGRITLFRNEIRPSLDKYFEGYRKRLLSHQATQEALIRKFDYLCVV
jgi:hypothetical protein